MSYEELMALAKEAKQKEKKQKESKWVAREKVILAECKKLNKDALIKELARMKVAEEKRLEINEKRKGTNGKKGKTEKKKCIANKCFICKETAQKQTEAHKKVLNYKYNNMKPCGKPAGENGYCKNCSSEIASYGGLRNGNYGEKPSFQFHKSAEDKEWVKMFYELHYPEEEKEEEKKEEEEIVEVEEEEEELEEEYTDEEEETEE